MTFTVGETCGAGRYELAERLAIGGMSEVWQAYDKIANAQVAVKIMRPEFTDDKIFLARLRSEAHNASQLHHPNVAAVLNYWEEDGIGMLAMEMVDGESLADVLDAHGTLTPAQLIPILIQCASALQAAHAAGVIHRDVKPGNILLRTDGSVKLTDFGISISEGQAPLTATGKVMGTAHYLAPELALGRPATAASDMYALGVVAYECLTGHWPFKGATPAAIAMAHVHQTPPSLPKTDNPELNSLVMRLLAKKPIERPVDCAQLVTLLKRCNKSRQNISPNTQLATAANSAIKVAASPDVNIFLTDSQPAPSSAEISRQPRMTQSPLSDPPSSAEILARYRAQRNRRIAQKTQQNHHPSPITADLPTSSHSPRNRFHRSSDRSAKQAHGILHRLAEAWKSLPQWRRHALMTRALPLICLIAAGIIVVCVLAVNAATAHDSLGNCTMVHSSFCREHAGLASSLSASNVLLPLRQNAMPLITEGCV